MQRNTAGAMLRTAVVMLLAALATGAPVEQDQADFASEYLRRYGYSAKTVVNEAMFGRLIQDTSTCALMDFQSFAGLNVTGALDRDTLDMMARPRCGVKDMGTADNSTRKKRFVLYGEDVKWLSREVTYRISRYSDKVGHAVLEDQIKKAFQVWSKHADITFVASSGQTDIDIRFVTGEHGDGYTLDGPGGELAHAFRPQNGDAHFDDLEPWTADSWEGTNILQVATHELGHALGLGHSDVPGAVMAPFYQQYNPDLDLTPDDVAGITRLYGPAGRGTTAAPSQPPSAESDLCADSSVDTMFRGPGGASYVFKGEVFYKLSSSGLKSGYPRNISEAWTGLPGHLDAALPYKRRIYFFKGAQYWRYKGFHVDGDYPRRIAQDFSGLPDGLDAAFMWKVTGGAYFFKGTEFWRCDMAPAVRCWQAPKKISVWRGVPDHLDAVTVYNGVSYFFKGADYYRFDDDTDAVDRSANPPFPRPIGPWWFGCKGKDGLHKSTQNREWDAARPSRDVWADNGGDSGASVCRLLLLATLAWLCC